MGLRPVLPGLILMLVGAGCNASTPSPARSASDAPREDPPTRSAMAETAAGNPAQGPQALVPDADIAQVVSRELAGDAVVGREPIRFACVRGIVTLTGDASNRLAHDRALAIVQLAEGVRAVVDRIAVARRDRSDDDLTAAATAALAADPVLVTQSVGATARDGAVRLSGTVTSIATMRIAESDVLALPGVTSVLDDVAVAAPTEMQPSEGDDARLAGEVERTMRDDAWLDDTGVQISVHQGVVLVTGRVPSAAECARAEADARASATGGIDVSALRIEPALDGTRRRVGPVHPTDRELALALRDAYGQDPRMRGFVPHVDVRDGVVVLAGIAPGPDAARAAMEDARNVPGVANTHGRFDSPATQPASDAVVMTRVHDALNREPRLSPRNLTVAVDHGHVIVGGRVGNESDRRRALEVATGTPGVLGVDDTIVTATSLARAQQP